MKFPKKSYKAKSYLEVNQKLFNEMQTPLNYFDYAIGLFFLILSSTKFLAYQKTAGA